MQACDDIAHAARRLTANGFHGSGVSAILNLLIAVRNEAALSFYGTLQRPSSVPCYRSQI